MPQALDMGGARGDLLGQGFFSRLIGRPPLLVKWFSLLNGGGDLLLQGGFHRQQVAGSGDVVFR